ncbi:MAG: hypothetical protein ACXAC5_04100 [Promethearchaeota archaeon]|jgi:hypothetical protein
MKIKVNIGTLGRGQLWNHCNERYGIMGLVCKEAGLEDDDMDHRMCVILKKDPKEEVNTRTLPDELSPFFVKTKDWNPISPHYKGSLKFSLNELGLRISGMNDALVSGSIGEDVDGWMKRLVALLFEGGVGVEWVTADNCSV